MGRTGKACADYPRDSRFELIGVPIVARIVRARRTTHPERPVERMFPPRRDRLDRRCRRDSVATAPMAHHDLVREALDRGLHVITEKPFAMSVDEGSAMVEDAARNRKCLAVVHNFQFARSMRRLKRDLAEDRLGSIRGVRAVQLGNPSRRLPSWYGRPSFGSLL